MAGCLSLYGDGGLELLVALGDLPWGRATIVAAVGRATIVAAARPYPQQSCETGISADAVRASPPLRSDSILR